MGIFTAVRQVYMTSFLQLNEWLVHVVSDHLVKRCTVQLNIQYLTVLKTPVHFVLLVNTSTDQSTQCFSDTIYWMFHYYSVPNCSQYVTDSIG